MTISFRKIHRPLEVVTFIVIILGVPGFFYQQMREANVRRIEHTLSYVEIFQSEQLVARRLQLLSPWFDYSTEIGFINSSSGVDEMTLRYWVDGIVDASIEADPQNNLLHAIYDTTDFFDQLHVCVKTKVCHKKTACKYFNRHAAQFYGLYGYRISSVGQDLDLGAFADGLKFFASESENACPS